jgi:hypothetical protein
MGCPCDGVAAGCDAMAASCCVEMDDGVPAGICGTEPTF